LAKIARLPDTPQWVEDLFNECVSEHPGRNVQILAPRMCHIKPETVVYVYRRKQSLSLSPKERLRFLTVKDVAQARNDLERFLRPSDRFEIDTTAFTRMKNRLNKRGIVIFGASTIGYVALKDMNFDRAARWAYPRLKQQQHESMHWEAAVNIMCKTATNEHDRHLTTCMMDYVKYAADYENLKTMTEAILARS